MRSPAATANSARLALRRRLGVMQSRSYSRFVALSKWALPLFALGLTLLVAVWPRIEATIENVRKALPRIDLNEARDLRMVNAHYSGIDRRNRPFVVTANVARQSPKSDDLVALEAPKADMTTLSGGWVEVNSDTGVYQPQAQLLDLFGHVILYQDKGNEFHTTAAHVDMAASSAEGKEAVEGWGPFGHINAEGFRVLNNGSTVIFTGRARLDLAPREVGKTTP